MSMMKKITAYFLAMLLVLGFTVSPVSGKVAQQPKLSPKAVTLYKGNTKTIQLNNNTKAVTWSTSDSKVVKITEKNKNKIKIKAIKTGTAYISAKVGKQTYKCKVTVKENKTLTVKQATVKLEKWLKDNNKTVKDAILVYDHKEGNNYVFQYYNDMGTHTATINWYYVNCKTGKITAMF